MTLEWRALRPGETDHETLWASVALALVVLFGCWLWLVEWPPVMCPFRVATGLPCPTCGATRSLFAMVGGRPLEAIRLNPLAGGGLLLSLPYLAYAGVVSLGGLPRLRVTWTARARRLGRTAAWCAILATWVFLIADGR